MSVYLGRHGQVQLKRSSDLSTHAAVVDPADVSVSRRRFSFDFDSGFLSTGDRINISSTNGAVLGFVDASGWLVGTQQSTGSWYVNVDELGGVRLYLSYDAALGGLKEDAIPLSTPNTPIPISVNIENLVHNILAQCTYFELNTNREVVDTTALGDEFRSQHSTLISGSGNFRALWEYTSIDLNTIGSVELPHYLLQLAIRTEAGSKFNGRFFLKTSGSGLGATSQDDTIWYEVEGLITQAGVNFAPDDIIEINADFVTTGRIRLLAQTSSSGRILQETQAGIRVEQGASGLLMQEDKE